jgi:peptidoglycan/LPS O-acetylase OafA/YrhL
MGASEITPTDAPKGHFMALDGLRGAAALAVLALHLPPLDRVVPHAYLAVDLFFMMSGFVVAHAYERRLLSGWSVSQFIRTRVIRLWPLYLLGTAIGAAVFATVSTGLDGVAALAVLVVAAIFMIPLPLGADVQIFNLNRPAWSLFFEMVANILYAVFARRLTDRVLTMLIALGAIAVAATFLAADSGSLGHHGSSMIGGAARILFAFPLGVLLHRKWAAGRLTLRWPAMGVFGLFLIVMLAPDVKGWNGVIDVAAVLLVLPVITALAVTARLSLRLSRIAAVVALMSYPLYILHGPIIMGFAQMLGETSLAVTLGGTVSLIAAFVAARWFDGPARALMARWVRQRQAVATTA